MDPLIIVLTIVITVFSVVLVVAGIQVILVLQEFKKTLRRVNILADTLEKTADRALSPLANLGGTIDGVKSGLKVAQAFMSWLNKEKGETRD